MNKSNFYYTEEIVNELAIGQLTNTDEDIFWYSDRKLTKRYKQEKSKKGDNFWDGNNGDKWEVIAAAPQFKRILVENISQNGRRLIYWD